MQIKIVDPMAYAFLVVTLPCKKLSEAFKELAQYAQKAEEPQFKCRFCGKKYMSRQEADACVRKHRRSFRGR